MSADVRHPRSANGAQYRPSAAKVAKALAMDIGATPVPPSRLPSWCMLTGVPSSPLWMPTASTMFWIPQISSCAASANVAVLMELYSP